VTLIELERFDGVHDFRLELTRSVFDELCEPLFQRCLMQAERALEEANAVKEDISEVVLVGGASRMLKIH